MARKPESGFGLFRGKVGALTGYMRGGRNYVRQSINKNESHTPAQLRQRNRFAEASSFCKGFKSVVAETYLPVVAEGQATWSAFQQSVMRNSLGESVEVSEEKWTTPILMPRVLVSMGNVEQLHNPTCEVQDMELKAQWDNEMADSKSSDDQIELVLYNAAEGQALLMKGGRHATRSVGERTVEVPAYWKGAELHVWILAHNTYSCQYSDSQYLGAIVCG